VDGHVVERGRPLLRVNFKEYDDGALLAVDTGFNGEIMMSYTTAQSLGIEIVARDITIRLGDGSRVIADQGLAEIAWLGRQRVVVTLIARTSGTDTARPHRDGEPIGLLGTQLIAPDILTINFGAQTLTIHRDEQASPI
jgi:predicted aspartyl protease